jgi:hypothetical protein
MVMETGTAPKVTSVNTADVYLRSMGRMEIVIDVPEGRIAITADVSPTIADMDRMGSSSGGKKGVESVISLSGQRYRDSM